MNSNELQGKTALVTGGGAGIGAEIATRLSGRGARVVIVDRDIEAARAVTAQLDGGIAVELDLADPGAITQALHSNPALSTIDILVNNAGATKVERFVDSNPRAWDHLWNLNLRAPMQLCHAAIPGMTERGWGRLIFIATDSARVGGGGEGVYSATKAGLLGLAKTLARETARDDITSNVICPGLIDTAMLRSVAKDNANFMERLLKVVPMRRAGSVAEVAAAVEFLCGPDSGYFTGQTMSVNGGVTMI